MCLGCNMGACEQDVKDKISGGSVSVGPSIPLAYLSRLRLSAGQDEKRSKLPKCTGRAQPRSAERRTHEVAMTVCSCSSANTPRSGRGGAQKPEGATAVLAVAGKRTSRLAHAVDTRSLPKLVALEVSQWKGMLQFLNPTQVTRCPGDLHVTDLCMQL